MGTENVDVKFVDGGVRRIAEIAFSVNEKTENIGARRLHTVMERLLESVSFDAAENGGSAHRDRRRLRRRAPRHSRQGRRPSAATSFRVGGRRRFAGVILRERRHPDENRETNVVSA